MSIKINSLKVDKISENSSERGYLYKDLKLDMEPAYSRNNQLNKNEYLKDVQALFDVQAVQNSVANCFLTSPGQKILNPTFGVDLRRFLFEAVDDFVADIIQDDIETKLPIMEPRVTVNQVTVDADEDDQQYNISLRIDIPTLGITGLVLKSKLSSIGYTIL